MSSTRHNLLVLLYTVLIGRGAWAIKSALPFVEADKDILGIHKDTKMAAFSDFNTDKRTDLIVIAKKMLQVLYSGDEKTPVTVSPLLNLNDTANLMTVVPGDFDGDLVTDFLLIYKVEVEGFRRLQLCFGTKSTTHYGNCVEVGKRSKGEPMILDYNADMKPDILVESSEGNLTLFVSDLRNFSKSDIEISSWGALLHPHSSAFVDLNRDLAADIALTTTDGLGIIVNKKGELDFHTDKACLIRWSDSGFSAPGMASFVDYDSDSYMDIIISSTKDKKTMLYALSGEALHSWLQGSCLKKAEKPHWHTLPLSLTDSSSQIWSLSQADSWLRAGDVDNDGFADLLVTLIGTDSGEIRPFILRNAECNETCTAGTRTFLVMWDWLPTQYDITQTAFFDMYNNGMLDILYNAQHDDGHTELHLFQNNVAKQSCFLSVKVGSGLCSYEDQANCNKPYANIVGPTIQYNSTHPDGTSAFGIATQLTQSTNGALQMPYIQFGLGTTPNFVDALTVGVARKKDQKSWTETWKTIVPNSHLVVVPRPPDQPDQWLMHLYVTPSHLVLVTGLVILGLCAVIAITISLLHFKERHQDRKAKLLEAQRFHFNAM